jgi:hypothetical protein
VLNALALVVAEDDEGSVEGFGEGSSEGCSRAVDLEV